MTDIHELHRDLRALEEELARLEAEYNKFFTHRRARPPSDLRKRVEARVRRWANVHISASVDRFRFSTLQARLVTYAKLWDQAIRAREEGRAGPFPHLESGSGAKRDAPGASAAAEPEGQTGDGDREVHEPDAPKGDRTGEKGDE